MGKNERKAARHSAATKARRSREELADKKSSVEFEDRLRAAMGLDLPPPAPQPPSPTAAEDDEAGGDGEDEALALPNVVFEDEEAAERGRGRRRGKASGAKGRGAARSKETAVVGGKRLVDWGEMMIEIGEDDASEEDVPDYLDAVMNVD